MKKKYKKAASQSTVSVTEKKYTKSTNKNIVSAVEKKYTKSTSKVIYHKVNQHCLNGIKSNPVIVKEFPGIIKQLYNNKYISKVTTEWEGYLSNNYNQKSSNIPFYVHVIWITKKHQPSEINDEIRNTFIHNVEVLTNANPGMWQFYLWLHNQEITPKTVSFCKNIINCNIREISELENYKQIKKTVNTLVNINLFSPASDLIRSNIMKEIGGIYIDTDYSFKNSPAILHQYFDFYAGFEKDGWSKQIGTGFIAAKPQHPVVISYNKIIQAFYGLGDDACLPYYLKNIVPCSNAALLTGGPASLTASYHFYKNLDTNKDIILQQNMIHEPVAAQQVLKLDNKKVTIDKIGTQNYHGSWVGMCNKIHVNLKDSVILSPAADNSCNQQQVDFGIAHAINKVIKSANNLTCSKNESIEFISHRAWLTNPSNPTFVSKEVLNLVLKSINTLDRSGQKWFHYWWSLKDEHYSNDMKNMFNQHNVVLKTVDELYPFYPGLEQAIFNAGKLSYSLSVDILKWVVIHRYGGLYTDIDYEFTSTKMLADLQHCSEAYLGYFNQEYVINGLLGSKKGGVIADVASKEYIRLMTDEPNKFHHCSRQEQIMLMNTYGHVKPFINLILSEEVDASSVILIPSKLILDKNVNECLKVDYGNIHLMTLGFDYRFNTWKSGNNNVNTQNMNAFSVANQNEDALLVIGKDLCEDVSVN